MGVAIRRVDLIPPAQPYQSSARDVFQVVEVGREKQEGDDKNEDAVVADTPRSVNQVLSGEGALVGKEHERTSS